MIEVRVESAIAVATSPVFSRKYMVAAPTSGRASVVNDIADCVPPRSWNASPEACTVITSDATLNSVRYSGLRALLFR